MVSGTIRTTCTVYDCEFDLYFPGTIIDDKVFVIKEDGNLYPAQDCVCEHIDCGRVQFFLGCVDEGSGEEPQKWGFFSLRTGKIIISPIYDYTAPFYGVRACVEKDGKFGVIDRQGNLVLKLEWDEIKNVWTCNDQMFIAKKDEKYGLTNKEGEFVLASKWDGIEDAGDCGYGNKLFIIKINGLFGYADEIGNIVVQPCHNRIYRFYGGMAVTSEGGKWGFINHLGQVEIEPIFEEVRHFYISHFDIEESEWLFGRPHILVALVKVDGLWGVINKHGKYIIAPQFDLIGEVGPNYLVVKKGSKWGYIDEKLNLHMLEGKSTFIIHEGKKVYIKNGQVTVRYRIKK